MPELPEVETVRRGLEPALKGKRIKEVILRRKGLRVPITEGAKTRLTGKKINGVERRAKYLLFKLSGKENILAHLGMSGRMVIRPSLPKAFETHDHIILALDDGSALIFNDARRFGIFLVVDDASLPAHPLLKDIGPEPLSKEFMPSALATAMKKRKGPIKTTLMDQRLVAGIGNIYASEILFLAGIRPTRRADKCLKDTKKLVESTRKVLEDAIRSGGSTLRDYVRSTGDPGYFQHHFFVYDREGDACKKCASTIRQTTQSGRSTYYCPRCQK